jgi:hypothetical protein
MTRKPHLLNKTSGNDRPTNVIFFDTETKQTALLDGKTKHTLKLGIAVYCKSNGADYLSRKSEIVIRQSSDLWRYVDEIVRPKTKTYLVAHNIVFDLTVLDAFSSLASNGWQLESFYSKAFTSIFRWRRGDQTLLGVDNSNFFQGKLEKWGEIVGYPKGIVDFDTVSDIELLDYCRGDVEIMIRLWQTWLSFLDLHKCGSFKLTTASTAFNTWRHRFMPSNVHIHANEIVLELERKAYKGGRVEALFQGELRDSEYYYLDVNNMYGYVLSNYEYPSSLYGVRHAPDIAFLKQKISNYACIADVLLTVDRNYFPLKRNSHTFYPLGTFRTALTTPELELALTNNWINTIYSVAWYAKRQLFSDYVTHFHTTRQNYITNGNKPYADICKMLINSLYGKFGQRGFKQIVIGETDNTTALRESIYDSDNDTYFYHIYLGGKAYKEWQEGEAWHSFPAIAAHVTAYARLYLSSLVFSVLPGHVFYMDTDSLIVDDIGLETLKPLLDSKELGKLKIEAKSPYLVINAPKDYEMESRRKTKGISEKAVQTSPGVYSQTQWVRLSGMLRAGDVSGYVTKQVEKRQKRIIYSGVVSPVGWVEPFLLAEAEKAIAFLPYLRQRQYLKPS